jgi:hypothetical protein
MASAARARRLTSAPGKAKQGQGLLRQHFDASSINRNVEARRLKGDSSAHLIGICRAPSRRPDHRATRPTVRRAPVRQSRPHQGQRPAGQHPPPFRSGRRPVEIKEPASNDWCRSTRAPSGMCPTISKSITLAHRQTHSRSGLSAKVSDAHGADSVIEFYSRRRRRPPARPAAAQSLPGA